MRQMIVAALMICSLPLAACGKGGDEALFESFRDGLGALQIVCEADVTSDYGGETETFTLACTEAADGFDLAVRAPEMLSGVTASVNADSTELRFDGLVVPVPERPDGVSPLLALPAMLTALRDGHIDLCWREGDLLAVQLVLEDDLAVRVLFDGAMLPVSGEVIAENETAARCTINQWTPTEREESHEPDDSNLGGDQSQHPGA